MRIGVIAVGNVLQGDDAVGPHVLAELKAGHVLPPEVDAIDAGTPGLDLSAYLEGFDAAVVIDAVRARGRPGEVRRYTRDELLAVPKAGPTMSPHDPGLADAVRTLSFHRRGPKELVLVGVIPERVETRLGIGPTVRAAVPAAVRAVLAELDRWGVAAPPRETPADPDLWWERAPDPRGNA
jgi:hydrogenase maturation protease